MARKLTKEEAARTLRERQAHDDRVARDMQKKIDAKRKAEKKAKK